MIYDTSFLFEELKNGKELKGIILNLTLYELANVLLKKVKEKKISVEIVKDVFDYISLSDIEIVSLTPKEFPEVVSLALKHGLSAYDASYLYISISRNQPLKTLDKKLNKVYRSVRNNRI